MGDRLLATIIELEKSLHEEVRQEILRADSWREREVAALEVAVTAAQQEVNAWLAGQVEAARLAAGEEGDRRVAACIARCTRLAALQEPLLEEVLRPRLRGLLPETGDDHPHGEG